jgi:hypothetical protein
MLDKFKNKSSKDLRIRAELFYERVFDKFEGLEQAFEGNHIDYRSSR